MFRTEDARAVVGRGHAGSLVVGVKAVGGAAAGLVTVSASASVP